MKAKKILALLLSTAMVAMTACGSGTNGGSSAAGGKENTAAESGNSAGESEDASGESQETSKGTGEVTTIRVSYPALVVVPSEEGTVEAENAINAYLEEKGESVRIDLDPIDGNNYVTQVDMAIVGGESIGLYCPLTGLDAAVQTNKVLPLDDYLDNELAGAIEVMGADFKKNCEFNGKTYALPCYKGSVLHYYWVCPKEVFDSLGVERESITNIRDLAPVLAKLKEMYPDRAPIAPSIGANGAGNSFEQMRVLGGAGDYEVTQLNNGLCVVGDDRTVQNMYATDFFKEACQIAYDWNQAGYTIKDASVSTDAPGTLMEADRACSYIIGYAYSTESVEAMSLVGTDPYETVAIDLSTEMLNPITLTWAIAYTCEDPDGAARVLNMLYTDEFVRNTLIFGVEGSDWVDAGTGDGSILWPEGKDMNSVPYTAALTCGIIGNQFIMYSMEGVTLASDIPFMASEMENAKKSPVFGFSVDITNIKTQTAAISNVIAQYEGGLLTGELDPEVYIPKLLEELEAAGMSDIVAEAQSQLDAWK